MSDDARALRDHERRTLDEAGAEYARTGARDQLAEAICTDLEARWLALNGRTAA